jgi:hypothetical protein
MQIRVSDGRLSLPITFKHRPKRPVPTGVQIEGLFGGHRLIGAATIAAGV